MAAPLQAEQGLAQGAAPLTPIQRWFFARQPARPQHYNQSLLLELAPGVDLARFEQVAMALVAHHDALRLRFTQAADGAWTQTFGPLPARAPFQIVDLGHVSDGDLAGAIEAVAEQAQRACVLHEGALMHIVAFDLGPERLARLLVVIHHLAVDGVSWRVLLEDLQLAYEALGRGEAAPLPPKTSSYGAWAERLQAHARTPDSAAELGYWLALPWDAVRPLPCDSAADPAENTVASVGQVAVALDAAETRALLQETSQAYTTQINDLLLTALARALGTWAGSETLLVDLEGHGREDRFDEIDLSRTVGWFTTIFPVLLEPGEQGGIGGQIRAVKEQLRRVPGNGLGYGLLRYLGDEAGGAALAALPQAEIGFNYLGQLDQALGDGDIFELADEPRGAEADPAGQRPHLIDINAMVVGGCLSLSFAYSQRVHRRETIERVAASFLAELRAIIAHCQAPESGAYTPSDFPLARLSAAQLNRIVAAVCAGDQRAAREQIEDIYPLAPLQQGLVFHSMLEPASGVYIEQIVLHLANVDQALFGQAWAALLERHAILRTAFLWDGLDAPLQVVLRHVTLPIRELDWSAAAAEEQDAHLEAFLASDRREGLPLSAAPLMHLTLIGCGDGRCLCVWTHHHVLLDGWSMPLLLQEVFARYAALSEGQPLELKPTRPYRDYVAWLQRQDLAEAERFWRANLADFSAPTALSILRPAGGADAPSFGERSLALGEDATSALQATARRCQVTLNTLVQGAWALVLSRYSGSDDVVFGVTVAGRPPELAGVEAMLGLFINTLPLRVRVPHGQPIDAWLRAIHAAQSEIQRFEYSPLAQVQRWSELAGGAALFESLLVFENYPLDSELLDGQDQGLALENLQTFERTNYPLTLIVLPGADLHLRLIYAADRIDPAAVDGLLGQLGLLLAACAARPTARLAELPALTPAAAATLAPWQVAPALPPAPASSLADLVWAQAARTPHAPALAGRPPPSATRPSPPRPTSWPPSSRHAASAPRPSSASAWPAPPPCPSPCSPSCALAPPTCRSTPPTPPPASPSSPPTPRSAPCSPRSIWLSACPAPSPPCASTRSAAPPWTPPPRPRCGCLPCTRPASPT